VELHCESLASSDGEDVTDAFVLLTIISILDEQARRQVMKIISRHAKNSEPVFNLDLFIRGRITLQELEARLKGQRSTD